jgi:ABC-type sugar transport system ATPase subunit
VSAKTGGRATLDGIGFSIEPPSVDLEARSALVLGIRPRDIAIVEPGRGDALARIDLVEPLGHEVVIRARLDQGRGPSVTIVVGNDQVRAPAEAVGVQFRRDRLHLFDAGDGTRMT